MKHLAYLLALSVLFIGFRLDAASITADGNYYEAFIKVNNSIDENALIDAGVTITARYQGFVTARIRGDVDHATIMGIPGVEHVANALPLFTCSDSARFFSRVDQVHVGGNFERPYTGKGVIVGVIDCGFDFNHINLCDSDGATRVKAVYMPLDLTGTSPVIDGVQLPGSCYETSSEIAMLTSDDPKTTHGTQTAGIAAGGYPDNGWYGMAPEADIVACGMPEGELNDVRVANCISYIHDYATRMGKPCVINISLGSNVGPHDGTSYFNRVCNEVSGPGSVIVVSAGNDGITPVCVHREIADAQDTVTTLLTGFRNDIKRSGQINARSKNGVPFNTRVVVVDQRTGELLYSSEDIAASAQGNSMTVSSTDDASLATYYTGTVDIKATIGENGNPSTMCDLNIKAVNRSYLLGLQFNSEDACDLSVWTSMYAYFNNYGFSWVENGTPMGSISDLATTDSVISVGSYNSRETLPLRDGSTYFRGNCTPTHLSEFTSYGPDERGINRPDVCAPGAMVISSGNRYDVTAPNLYYWQPSAFVNDMEYPYCPDLGTSMSAPVVAGTIALWMEAEPTLSANDVRDVLKHSCYKDVAVLTTENMDLRWGYGKLDADAGMRYVLHIEPKNGDVNNDGDVNISDINVIIDILLGGLVDSDTMRRADVNNDREVTISDINALLDIILN